MEKYKIDTDIPIPKPPKNIRYPFLDLEINDSFKVIPKARKTVLQTVNGVRANLHYYKNCMFGRKFAIRVVEEEGIEAVRVWRVK